MWFETLTGFREESQDKVWENMSVNGKLLKSHVNGMEYTYGLLETPSLAELRNRVNQSGSHTGTISIREVIVDVQQLHIDESNSGSLFQVASQFNLLEMASPDVTPEQGVEGYEYDRTQGPACAIAAGAGTIYRNYFVNVNGESGQTSDNQIDCLGDIGKKLGNFNHRLWEMRNGYALASEKGLIEISNTLNDYGLKVLLFKYDIPRISIRRVTVMFQVCLYHLISDVSCGPDAIAYRPEMSAPIALS